MNYYKEGVWPEEFEKPKEGDGGDEEEGEQFINVGEMRMNRVSSALRREKRLG